MKRRHSLYCTVISAGPLVILRMPSEAVRWRELLPAINAVMRGHDTKAKDIHAVEGLADPDTPETVDAIALLEAAFAGDPERFAAFNLHKWDDESRQFTLARAAQR